jgi:hypothetical protein
VLWDKLSIVNFTCIQQIREVLLHLKFKIRKDQVTNQHTARSNSVPYRNIRFWLWLVEGFTSSAPVHPSKSSRYQERLCPSSSSAGKNSFLLLLLSGWRSVQELQCNGNVWAGLFNLFAIRTRSSQNLVLSYHL